MKRERWTKEYHWTRYPGSEIEICGLNEREAGLTEWIPATAIWQTGWLTTDDRAEYYGSLPHLAKWFGWNKPAQSAYLVRTVNCIEVAYEKSIANASEMGLS